jgi:glycosyltransferase involved in cell wall biosynthesis
MRIVHINKSDVTGGASVAASRIVMALREAGMDASLLVAEKKSNLPWVHSVLQTRRDRAKMLYNFMQEVAAFLPYEKSKSGRFAFSLSRRGFDLSSLPIVKEADVLHLHWFNQGYLSLNGLEKLFNLGKPVVWTFHDMWSFSGGCHYAGSCKGFEKACGHCPVLRAPSSTDPSSVQHARKQEIYADSRMWPVTCSGWLASEARRSSLLRGMKINSIPNPIDTNFYKPVSRKLARQHLNLPEDKKILLFGAANVADPRKGMALLLHALKVLAQRKYAKDIELVIFGKAPAGLAEKLPFPSHLMHYISDPEVLVDLYNAADVFVLPSLEDNLPNTVMESLSCGTPVAAFRIGGVPEMVAHGTCGYLAAPGDAKGLAEAIDYLLLAPDPLSFRDSARNKVLHSFSPDIVARKYIKLYESILKCSK